MKTHRLLPTPRDAVVLLIGIVIACLAGALLLPERSPVVPVGTLLKTRHGQILATRQSRRIPYGLVQTLTFLGKPGGVSRHAKDFSRILLRLKSDPGVPFQSPVQFRSGNEDFLYVMTIPTGSSGFVDEFVFRIAPDLTLQRVAYVPASRVLQKHLAPGEVAVPIGPGIILSNGKLEFVVRIARPQDPNCCPSGRTIRGTYGIVEGDSGFRVVVTGLEPAHSL